MVECIPLSVTGDSKVEMCVKKLIGQERMLWIVLVFLNMGEVLLC